MKQFFAFWLKPSVTSAQTMCEFTYGKKAAGVTVETLLAITLAVVVLFFVLNIFGDNLKTMVASSGIQRMYDNSQKTTYGTQQYDPTSVNVQVLAEQGNTVKPIDDYKTEAETKIDGYIKNPPRNQEEVFDLAKWATIAKIITVQNPDNSIEPFLSMEQERFCYKYGIDIGDFIASSASNFNTKIKTGSTLNNYTTSPKILEFTIDTNNTGNQNQGTDIFTDNPQNQLSAIQSVIKNNFQ